MSQVIYQTYPGDPRCEMKAVAMTPELFPIPTAGLSCKPCVTPRVPTACGTIGAGPLPVGRSINMTTNYFHLIDGAIDPTTVYSLPYTGSDIWSLAVTSPVGSCSFGFTTLVEMLAPEDPCALFTFSSSCSTLQIGLTHGTALYWPQAVAFSVANPSSIVGFGDPITATVNVFVWWT